jgi:hypothetical protein
MKTVSNGSHESKGSALNFNQNTDTRNNVKQSHQPDLSFSFETEKYSEKGLLLHGSLKYFPCWSFVIDLSIVLWANFLMNFLKYGGWSLGIIQVKLLFLYLTVWLFVSFYFDKFQINSYPSYKKSLIFIVKSWVSVFFITVNILVLLEIYSLSHIHFFGICLLHVSLELIAFSIYFLAIRKKINEKPTLKKAEVSKDNHFSTKRMILDFLAFASALLLINYLKHNTFNINNQFEGLILITVGLCVNYK